MKKTWGPLAYLRSAMSVLSQLHAYRTIVSFGRGKRAILSVYNVVIANGRYVGGGTMIAPEASIDDGLLDVILIRDRPAADLALLAAQVALGKHLESDTIVFERAAKVRVQSRPGMWFNVDGELVGNEPATFEVLPGALRFVVSKP
jgi:diacylglycerol kinase (ATP)